MTNEANPNVDETWNTCPDCGFKWKDEKATPQLLHRTRLCGDCSSGAAHGRAYESKGGGKPPKIHGQAGEGSR